MISLYSPETEEENDYKNLFELVMFSQINIYNMSYYEINDPKALFMNFESGVGDVTIYNINISHIECYL